MTLQTSRNTNKRVISTFNFGYRHLTLKEWPKLKSDHIKWFLAPDFLYDGFTLQTSWTKKKRFISILDFAILVSPRRKGPRSNLTTSKESQPMISYRLVSHCKCLGPIISDDTNNFKFGYLCFTSKEGPKVKSDHIKRFLAHDFL